MEPRAPPSRSNFFHFQQNFWQIIGFCLKVMGMYHVRLIHNFITMNKIQLRRLKQLQSPTQFKKMSFTQYSPIICLLQNRFISCIPLPKIFNQKSYAVNVFQDLSFQDIGRVLTLNHLVDDVAQIAHEHHSYKHDKL